ncbi:MAG: hypothetical protein ABSE79_13925 [Terriglobia bacterium]
MKTKDRYLGLAQTLLLNVCDAPKAHFGQLVPPVEQSENVIENKGWSWKTRFFPGISSLAKDLTLHMG